MKSGYFIAKSFYSSKLGEDKTIPVQELMEKQTLEGKTDEDTLNLIKNALLAFRGNR